MKKATVRTSRCTTRRCVTEWRSAAYRGEAAGAKSGTSPFDRFTVDVVPADGSLPCRPSRWEGSG